MRKRADASDGGAERVSRLANAALEWNAADDARLGEDAFAGEREFAAPVNGGAGDVKPGKKGRARINGASAGAGVERAGSSKPGTRAAGAVKTRGAAASKSVVYETEDASSNGGSRKPGNPAMYEPESTNPARNRRKPSAPPTRVPTDSRRFNSAELLRNIKESNANAIPVSSAVASRKAAVKRESRGSIPVELRVNATDDEQFFVIMDGKSYRSGGEPGHKVELRLTRGEHTLRIMTRHPLEREPRDFVPLLFAVWLMNGHSDADMGPYVAAFDATVRVDDQLYDALPLQDVPSDDIAPLPKSDCKLNIRLTQKPAGSAKGKSTDWNYAAGYSGGATCERMSASMYGSRILRRHWLLGNWTPVALAGAFGAGVAAVGLKGALSGGNVGGGIFFAGLGLTVVLACAWVGTLVRSAYKGARLPSISVRNGASRGGKSGGDTISGGTVSNDAVSNDVISDGIPKT